MIRALMALILLSAFTPAQKASLVEAGEIRITYVHSDHPLVYGNKVATAYRMQNGVSGVLINVDADQEDFEQRLMHEIAHVIAWQRHGTDIKTHGLEFRRICRELIKQRQKYYCQGD